MEVNGAMPFGLGPVAEQSREQAQGNFVYCSRHDLTVLIFQLTGSFEVKKIMILDEFCHWKPFMRYFVMILCEQVVLKETLEFI